MIVVNGREYRTLSDEIYIGPKNVIAGKKTVSKIFESGGYVLNVTSGPEDLRVVWVLYYNGTLWPNLVMFSEEQASVTFNTSGSVNSNQTSSPLTLGSGGNGGTFTSGGRTYYYNGIDYNGSYRENQLGWPVYTGTYQDVVDSYSGYADLGTVTGVISSDDKVDTTNKVIEVYVNGVKVYPEADELHGDIVFFIDTSGSMSWRKAENGLMQAIARYGTGNYMIAAYGRYRDGSYDTILESTDDIDEVKNTIQSMSYNGDGDDDYPFDSLQSLISVAPYKHIAVIGDSEFNFSAEDSQVITDLCKEYGKDWAFFDTGGVRTIWWTADPSYVVEDEDAELCYMDAGGYHRTYLKANQGPAMFVLAYIPSGKIHEVIGMSPNSSAAAYKWPYFGPDLTNMHTANGSGGQNYDGAPFSTSWYGGLYDNYGTPKDPVEWSYIPQMTIDVPMGDRQGVLDAVAEAAGLQVSFSEVEGWYKSSVG